MSSVFDPLTFLAARGLADARGLSVEPLSGGYQNQVFRVRGSALDWVVKRFGPSAPLTLFPNLPEAEALALERLAVHGAAPRPVAFVADGREAPVLVYEFYAGRPWNGDVGPVARLLHAIAGADPAGFRFVSMVPRDILEQGESFVAACPPGARQALRAARPRPIPMTPGPRRLIHTDFGPGNLIAGAHGLKAIDWQCPAAGDAAEDLAAFLSPAFQILYGRAPLAASEEAELVDVYGDAATVARLRLLRPFFDWRMAAYCALRQHRLATTHPDAAARYRRAAAALLERLGAHA
jgi:aminoglycoside phosphotransferase (APT) family kinase protein